MYVNNLTFIKHRGLFFIGKIRVHCTTIIFYEINTKICLFCISALTYNNGRREKGKKRRRGYMILVCLGSFDSDEVETSSYFLGVKHTLNLHFIKKV